MHKFTSNNLNLNYGECNQNWRGFKGNICEPYDKCFVNIKIDDITFNDYEVLLVQNMFQPADMIIDQNVINTIIY